MEIVDREKNIWKHYKRNFLANLTETSIGDLGFGFIGLQTFLPVFVSLFTDSKMVIGLVGSGVPVGWLIPQIFVAAFIERLGRKKAYVIGTAVVEKILFCFIALLAFQAYRLPPALLISLIVLITFLIGIAGGFTRPAWSELMATIFPPETRGKYYGSVAFTGGILAAIGSYLGGIVLSKYNLPNNYALSFLIGGALMIFSWSFLFWIKEPAPLVVEKKPLSGMEFFKSVFVILKKDSKFTAFLVAQCGIILSTMASYFLAVFAREKFTLDGYQLGILTTCLTLGSTVFSPVFGWAGDRMGHRRMLVICAGLQIFGFLFAVLSPTPVFLYISMFVIGVSRVGSWVNAQPIVFEYAPIERRPTYIGLSSTLFGLATIVTPIVGGLVAEGFGYNALFVLTIFLSIIAFFMYLFMVKEPASRLLIQEVQNP